MSKTTKAPDAPDTHPGPTDSTQAASIPAWKPGDPIPERPATLMGRMSYIAAELDRVPKRGFNEHFRYHYALEGDVMAVLNPLMAKWGVYLRHFPQTDRVEEKVHGEPKTDKWGNAKPPEVLYRVPYHIEWVNTDDYEDAYTSEWMSLAIDNSDKGLNKAYTAALKYAMLKTFGIATGDDPDAGGAHELTPQLPPAQAAAQHQGMVDKLQGQQTPRAPRPSGPQGHTAPEPEWLTAGVVQVDANVRQTSSGTSINNLVFDLGEGRGQRAATLFGSGGRLKVATDAKLHGTVVEVKLSTTEFRGKTEYRVDDIRELQGTPAPKPATAPAPDAHLFDDQGGDDDIPF